MLALIAAAHAMQSYHGCRPCWHMSPCTTVLSGAEIIPERNLTRLAPNVALHIGGLAATAQGFWVRVLVVLAQAAEAVRLGLPVDIRMRTINESRRDIYLDRNHGRQWESFFEPVHANPSLQAVQLDCASSLRAWLRVQYASTHAQATQQRLRHIALMRALNIRLREDWKREADRLFDELVHPASGEAVLGVHLRGTDSKTTRDHRGTSASATGVSRITDTRATCCTTLTRATR